MTSSLYSCARVNCEHVWLLLLCHCSMFVGDWEKVFNIEPYSGQLSIARDFFRNGTQSLNFESAITSFAVGVTASRRGFDSGWSPFRSMEANPGRHPARCGVLQRPGCLPFTCGLW